MGAYREQLLKETYGSGASGLYEHQEEEPTGSFVFFKLKFMICLLLFAGFAYLSLTGETFCNVTAEQIVEAVTNEDLYIQLSELGLYE